MITPIRRLRSEPAPDAGRARHRLPNWVAGSRGAYLVLLLWLIVGVAAAGFAYRLGEVQEEDRTANLPRDAESAQVINAQAAFTAGDSVPAVIVYQREGGLTDADRAKVAADAALFARHPNLGGTVDGPTFAADGAAARIIVPLDLGPGGFNQSDEIVDSLTATARHQADGLTAHVTGPAGTMADQSRAVGGLDVTLLLTTMGVVVVILLVVYRSPLLWLLPVVAAGVSLLVARALLYLLARYADLTVTADGASILTVLVFGAATDYALLLVARYREELARYADRHQAMAVALRRSTPAILASAGTVVAGMLCLLLADTTATRGYGPIFALGIVVGAAVMLTLFPALLVTVGRWVFWPARVRSGTAEPEGTGRWWVRLGHAIGRRPRAVWVVTALALVAMSAGILRLDSGGLSADEEFRGNHDSIVGQEILARHFAAGAGSPIAVLSRPERAADVRQVLATTAGVEAGSVREPVVRAGQAYLEATLLDAADSPAAYDTVDRVRARLRAVPDAEARVGGPSAASLDEQRAAERDRNVILPAATALVLLILIVLLRALVAPLILIATVVLSFGSALGVSALVYPYLFGTDSTAGPLPLFAFVFLVSLGIDYNIFLMTRIREETAQHGTRPATLSGLRSTGGVITSAGLVLAGTFAVLAVLPLTQIAQLGFTVAFGVLLDTLVVRSILVTALNLDIGRRIWWPGRLSRLPDSPSGATPLGHRAGGPPLLGTGAE